MPGQQDKYFWAIYLMLVVISIIELYSASSREVVAGNVYLPIIRHAVMLGAGFVVILHSLSYSLSEVHQFIPIFVVGSIVMMIYVLVAGDIINGARRMFLVFRFCPAALGVSETFGCVAYRTCDVAYTTEQK